MTLDESVFSDQSSSFHMLLLLMQEGFPVPFFSTAAFSLSVIHKGWICKVHNNCVDIAEVWISGFTKGLYGEIKLQADSLLIRGRLNGNMTAVDL